MGKPPPPICILNFLFHPPRHSDLKQEKVNSLLPSFGDSMILHMEHKIYVLPCPGDPKPSSFFLSFVLFCKPSGQRRSVMETPRSQTSIVRGAWVIHPLPRISPSRQRIQVPRSLTDSTARSDDGGDAINLLSLSPNCRAMLQPPLCLGLSPS